MPKNRYAADPNRLFKAAPTPSAIPPRFSITDSQSFLHALAEASAAHRVSRTQTGDGLTSTTEGGSRYSVTPAGSQQELDDQLALLTRAFEQAEGHPPSASDDAYWIAANELMDTYDGPELDAEDIMGGLS